MRLGPYELLDSIGKGGMGEVYRARHLELGVERAVKVLDRLEPRAQRRFEREVEHLAAVRDPHVVAIHDSGQADGRCYYAMELVVGQTLEELLVQRGALPWRRALELLRQLCTGVAALHRAGIVHRDLKPQNVMVNAAGAPIVVDFGLAIASDDERLTRTGAMVGTLGYMAPEQVGGKGAAVSARADVYALGLILYELLTGEPAIEVSGTFSELMGRILEGQLTPPSEVDPALPARLDAVVAQASARKPELRYADAEQLALALREVLEDPGPSARRRRVAWGLVGAALLLSASAGLAGVALRTARLREPPAAAASATPSPAEDEGRRAARAALREVRRAEDLPERYRLARAWLERHGALLPEQAARVREDLARRAARDPFRRLQPSRWGRLIGRGDPPRAILIPEGPGRRPIELWDLARGERQRSWEISQPSGEDGQPVPLVRVAFAFRPSAPEQGPVHHELPVETSSLCVVPGTTRVVAGGPAGELVEVGRPEGPRLFPRLPAAASAIAVSRDHRFLAATHFGHIDRGVDEQPSVFLYDYQSGRPLGRRLLVGSGSFVAFSPDGLRCAVGTLMGRVLVFETEALLDEPQVLVGSGIPFQPSPFLDLAPACRGAVRGVAFAGGRLYACSRGQNAWQVDPSAGGVVLGEAGDLRSWRLSDGQELEVRLDERRGYRWLDVSPDGRWLLVAQDDGGPTDLWRIDQR